MTVVDSFLIRSTFIINQEIQEENEWKNIFILVTVICLDPFFKHTVACVIAAVDFKTNYATAISDTPNSCSKTFY